MKLNMKLKKTREFKMIDKECNIYNCEVYSDGVKIYHRVYTPLGVLVAGAQIHKDNDYHLLEGYGVEKNYRRCGIASVIIRDIVDSYLDISAMVDLENVASLTLLLRYGFELTDHIQQNGSFRKVKLDRIGKGSYKPTEYSGFDTNEFLNHLKGI